ncbi:hypothetical protein NX059_011988 [Plenodomus lindquistii]|nr:hypothetical protein NX059_011988 [Plenodomus lindquistii]
MAYLSTTDGEAAAPSDSRDVRVQVTHSHLRAIKVPALPAELWGEICTHVDARTLWMTIRPVSQLLRAEAEREMTSSRLPKLCTTSPFEYGNCGQAYKIKQLSHYAEDDQRVYIATIDRIHAAGPHHDIRTLSVNKRRDRERLIALIRDRANKDCATDTEDLALLYLRSFDYSGQICLLILPELKIELVEAKMSFDWKRFLANYFHKDALGRSNREESAFARAQDNRRLRAHMESLRSAAARTP